MEFVTDLDKQLKGLKARREEKPSKTTAPQTNRASERTTARGKEIEIEIASKDLKKLEPVEVNAEFLESLGFENEAELREALREQMVERIEYDVKQAMREQVNRYLAENVQITLPAKMSTRQEQRVVQRRAMDLMTRGVPQEQIAANVEKLRTGARDEAARELKLFFILQKIATDQNTDVDEAELNGRIAMLAAQRGQRPEKLKQEMSKDGTLANLYVQMREQKAVDQILESAEIEDARMMLAEPEVKADESTKSETLSEDSTPAKAEAPGEASAEAEKSEEKPKKKSRKKKAESEDEGKE